MAKKLSGGKRSGAGRPKMEITEKKRKIYIGIWLKNSQIEVLEGNSEKFIALKLSVKQAFNEGIENILKIND